MKDEKSSLRIEISYKTIIFTALFALGIWFLVLIKEIIILVFLSVLILSALLKPVDWLAAKKVPRVLSVILVYILVILVIGFVIGTIVPPLVKQTSEFASKTPQIIDNINNYLIFHQIPTQNISGALESQLSQIAENFISITTAIFSSIFLILTLFVLSFYMLLEWKKLVKLVTSPFSGKQEKLVANIVTKVEYGLGRWVRGQLLLSLIVGVMTYIGLRLLGIPFALPLSLIAGILEIVPIVGPIIASIPAILVGLASAPILGLAVAALFLIVQQIENNLLVPVVMSKVVGLQPPVIIIALLIGAKLAGVMGAFLAIPLVVVAKIIAGELLSEDQKFEDDMEEQ